MWFCSRWWAFYRFASQPRGGIARGPEGSLILQLRYPLTDDRLESVAMRTRVLENRGGVNRLDESAGTASHLQPKNVPRRQPKSKRQSKGELSPMRRG